MRTHFFIIFLFVFIGGCTSVEFVRKDLTPQKQGVLRFVIASNPSRDAEYRLKAKEMAREFCGGDFEITHEYQAREESQTSTGVSTGVHISRSASIVLGASDRGTQLYNFIEFVCK